jgi:hypothetical protein
MISARHYRLQITDADITPFAIDDGLNDDLDLSRERDLWVVDKQNRYIFDNVDWDTLSNKHKL